MTSRLGLGLLALALCTGYGAVARAQQGMPPSGGTGPAPGGEQPGALPAPGQPPGQAESPDQPAAEEETSNTLPPRVPWRGTSFRWSNAVTTQTIGIGSDYQSSSGDNYSMSFAFLVNYYLVDQDAWKLNVYVAPSFGVELTNSDWTTTYREPLFDDLPLAGNVSGTLYKTEDSAFVTSASGNLTLIFPTSPTSYDIGTYLTTSPRLALSQVFPLAGESAPVFKSFDIGLSGRWDHRFGAASTAVNADLARPRQTSGGSTFLSDQLSFSPLAENTVRESISLSFPQQWGTHELTLSGAFSFAQSFKPDLAGNDCEVQLLTGCVKADRDPDARTSQNSLGFSVALTYFPLPEAGVSLAYANMSGQLGPDGTRRNIFWTPDALFSADLMISFDAIYERITGPARDGSLVMAKNKPQPQPSTVPLTF
jgi:hypothetical protein